MNIDKVTLLDKTLTLCNVYGNNLETVVYTQGVGISARLRIEKLGYPSNAKQYALSTYSDLVVNRIKDESHAWKNDGRAGLIWLDDLYEITKNLNHVQPIIDQADAFVDKNNPILDTNIQVEDQFFVSAVLGRAYKYTSKDIYLDFMISHILDSPLQREDGIYIHSKIAEYPWGRGNGFAIYGAVEALKYIPDNHVRKQEVIQKHIKHINSLKKLQTENGAWRQVIDNDESYEELTATSMIGYGVINDIMMGILPKEYLEMVIKAWKFVDSRVEDTGIVHDSCTGTGSLDSIEEYLIRKRENGFDNRGGSLSAWFLESLFEYVEDNNE